MLLEVKTHRLQHRNQMTAANRVEYLIALFAVDNDPLCSQDSQMLREVCLLYAQSLDQASRGDLSFAQNLNDGDAGRMSQRLKNVRFESSESILHRALPFERQTFSLVSLSIPYSFIYAILRIYR